MSRRTLRLLPLLLLPACYTTTIHSGLPASPATVAYDHRWHHGLFYGIAELSSPYDLSQVCPQGWSEIETEQSFLNGLLAMVGGAYSSQTVTVRCAATPRATRVGARDVPPTAATTQPADPMTVAPTSSALQSAER
jgi:hypothetical protein